MKKFDGCLSCAERTICTKICTEVEHLLPKERAGEIHHKITLRKMDIQIDEKGNLIPAIKHYLNKFGSADEEDKILNERKRKRYRFDINYRHLEIERHRKNYESNYWREYHKEAQKRRKDPNFKPKLSKRGNVLGRPKGCKDLVSRRKTGYFLRWQIKGGK